MPAAPLASTTGSGCGGQASAKTMARMGANETGPARGPQLSSKALPKASAATSTPIAMR